MLPSGLSMLWETVDPAKALRTRFGFDGPAAAVDWISTILRDGWAIAVLDCRRIVISHCNAIVWVDSDRGPLVIKWSNARDRFVALEKSARLMQRLDQQGIPLAAPIESTEGCVRVTRSGPSGPLSVAVLPELSGDWLDTDDDAAVRAAGACLARVHQALRGHSGTRAEQKSEPRKNQIEHWLANDDPGWAPSASSHLKTLVAKAPPLGGRIQLIHNDFRAANLLTRDSRIVGVLDFDELTWDLRINELARASVYLGTRFRDWRPTTPDVRREFRAGYESVRRLESDEDQWFECLVWWHAIRAVPAVQDPGGWAAAL